MRALSYSAADLRELTMGHGIGRIVFKDFFGKAQTVGSGPQAYIAHHLDAESKIYPHFHDVDQFQVVVGGSGWLGKQQIRPVVAHYADAYSPYGPIIQGGDLEYFTLRPVSASGGWRMPQNRHLLPGKPGRVITVPFSEFDERPSVRGEVRERILWGPDADQLRMGALHVGPDTSFDLGERGGGQYLVVTSGSVICGGNVQPTNSLIFVERDEPTPRLDAGPEGAVVLILTYPLPSERPGSDPTKLGERSSDFVIAASES